MIWHDISVIVTLLLLETLLSIDNAVVLAILVSPLPEKQQAKALRYGIIGAYVFRGLCLVFATWLIHIWWLKIIGGLYLIWLAFDYFKLHYPMYTLRTSRADGGGGSGCSDTSSTRRGQSKFRESFGVPNGLR